MKRNLIAALAAAGVMWFTLPAQAGNVIDEWDSVEGAAGAGAEAGDGRSEDHRAA